MKAILARMLPPVGVRRKLFAYNLKILAKMGLLQLYNSNRIKWLYATKREIKLPAVTFRPAIPTSNEDIAFCERIIKSFHLSKSALSGIGHIWDNIVQTEHGELLQALEKNDTETLLSLLSTMFIQKFLYGISPSDLFNRGIPIEFMASGGMEAMVSLAEALGVINAETPEQGITASALDLGLEHIAGLVEQKLDISINFPNVGAPYGIQVGERLIPFESTEHIYVASRLKEAINLYLPAKQSLSLVEIGAGYSGVAYWLLRLLNTSVSSYTIIDLPSVNVFQAFFLGKVFGYDKIVLFGEEKLRENQNELTIVILPPQATESFWERDEYFDVLLNENSMPEMPEQTVNDYLVWAKHHLRGLFYSYNQEAATVITGVAQNIVPHIVDKVGGFTRLSRNYSWLRRGYVEELYRFQQKT